MEVVFLRCLRCRDELRREVPPDREFVGAYCLCKSAGDARAAHDPTRMLEVARMPPEDLVPVG